MPASAAQPRFLYRARREAIGRKTMFQAEFLMTDDDIEASPATRSNDLHCGKLAAKPAPRSPMSVASLVLELVPEVQPINLPDSWIMVGKGGRPLKNAFKDKMYDAPRQPAKAKRVRVRNVCDEDEDEESLFLACLEEAPSSLKCTQLLQRSVIQHNKHVTRSREAKMWARYRLAKQEELLAHAAAFMLSEVEAADNLAADNLALFIPRPTKQRRFANSHAEKTRRKVRQAHARERCYWPESEDEAMPPAQDMTARKVLARVEEEQIAPMTTKPVAIPEPTTVDQGKGKGMLSKCSIM
jgi:hypothetical protein